MQRLADALNSPIFKALGIIAATIITTATITYNILNTFLISDLRERIDQQEKTIEALEDELPSKAIGLKPTWVYSNTAIVDESGQISVTIDSVMGSSASFDILLAGNPKPIEIDYLDVGTQDTFTYKDDKYVFTLLDVSDGTSTDSAKVSINGSR